VGVIENAVALHIDVVWFAITGLGLIVTLTVNVTPTHAPAAPEVGVTVYVAVWTMLVGLVSVCAMEATPVTCALDPVMPPDTTGAGHVYVVPAGTIVAAVGTPLAGVIENALPLQMVADCAGITGFGLTVTATWNVAPTHEPAAPEVGVTVYVTVCTALVGLVNVWLMFGWGTAWALAPVTPPVMTGAPHVYVVPAGTMVAEDGTPSDGAIVNAVPLQIEGVWFAITGFGFTVTVNVKFAPTQAPAAPDFGVTVYVAVWTRFVGFVNVWEMLGCPTAWALPPVTPPVTTGAVQV
jgi:hypothetical protein